MSEYKTLAKNTVIFAVGQFSVKVIQFFLMPILTIAMTTEDYGSAESVVSLVELLIPLFTLGLQDAVFRFCMRKDVGRNTVLSSTMAVVLIGLIFIVAGSLLALIKLPMELCILFIFLYICYALSNIWGQYIRGAGYIKTYAACGVLQAIMLAGCVAIFVYWQRWGTFGYLLAMVLAYFCSICVMFFGGKIFKCLSFKAIDKSVLKDMLKYALPLIPNGISWWFMQVVNRYIIIGFLGESAAGLYISSAKIATIINIFGTVFLQAWTISTVNSLEDKDKGEFNSRVFKIYNIFIQLCAFAILLILPYVSMFLLKGEFYEAWRYSSIAIYTAIFSCYGSFFGAFYGANMKTKVALFSTLAGAVVNTAFCFLLIQFLKLDGVLFANLLGYIVMAVVRIITTRKYSDIKINWIKETVVLLILFADALMILYSAKIPTGWYFGAQGIAIALFFIIKFKDIKLFIIHVIGLIKKLRDRRKAPANATEQSTDAVPDGNDLTPDTETALEPGEPSLEEVEVNAVDTDDAPKITDAKDGNNG